MAFDGSLYISEVDSLLINKTFYHDRTLGYIMPKWKSFEIDDLFDLSAWKQSCKTGIDLKATMEAMKCLLISKLNKVAVVTGVLLVQNIAGASLRQALMS